MNTLRMILTTSLLAIGGFILADTVDVWRGNETGEVNLRESTVNDGTIRSLTLNPILDKNLGETVDPESIECSSPEESWTHAKGSLTAVEVPMLDTHGMFSVSLKAKINVNPPKGEGSSKDPEPPPPGWTGTAIGHYNIKKCTCPSLDKSDTTAWNPPGYNLQGYRCPIRLFSFSYFPTNPYATLADLGDAVIFRMNPHINDGNNDDGNKSKDADKYAFFARKFPEVLDAKKIGEGKQCPICKTAQYYSATYLVDIECLHQFRSIALPDWSDSSKAGGRTQKYWATLFDTLKNHEIQHEDDFFNLISTRIYPMEYKFKACKNADEWSYANQTITINYNKKDIKDKVDAFVNKCCLEYLMAAAKADAELFYNAKSWDFYSSSDSQLTLDK